MAGSLYNADNVVVGHAVLFLTPWVAGTVAPLVPDETPLFDVSTWETAGWSSAGATNEGFKITADTSTTTVTIEEQATPVGEQVDGKSLAIEAALAEDTLTSMSYAWGGSDVTTTAASTGKVGTAKMTLVNEIKYFTACLEMKNYLAMPRRIYIPKMSMSGSGDTTFRRAADKRTYPIKLNSLCRPDEIQVVDVVAAAL